VKVDPVLVAARVAALRERVGAGVELLAVTKGFGADAVEAAAAAGCTMVGENYAQELLAKADTAARTGVAVHFIGRVQSNKVRPLAPVVSVWESVDRASILAAIARRSPGATVLIQVNATAEAAKAGAPPDDVAGLVGHGREAGLRVDGLMTIGPTDGDAARTRAAFELVARLADRLDLPVRSMGMSADLDAAVAAGSTRVRVGTALFGARPHRV
jgi:pyridoxal phosphate enzyme (YggS family)